MSVQSYTKSYLVGLLFMELHFYIFMSDILHETKIFSRKLRNYSWINSRQDSKGVQNHTLMYLTLLLIICKYTKCVHTEKHANIKYTICKLKTVQTLRFEQRTLHTLATSVTQRKWHSSVSVLVNVTVCELANVLSTRAAHIPHAQFLKRTWVLLSL